MMVRTALLVCAVSMVALSAPANADNQRCEETNFRVYFEHGSASLDQTALETMNLAERNVAGCSSAALQVSLDRSNPLATARAASIRVAARGHRWNQVRVDQLGMQQASFGGPEFAQVTMSPHALPAARNGRTDAGV